MLVDEVQPRCIHWLLRRFNHSGLSYEDCEDCYNDAVEGLLRRGSNSVQDPYNYVFTSARNAALDLIKERRSFVNYDPEWQYDNCGLSSGSSDALEPSKTLWTVEAMTSVAESALDTEISARDEQLRAILLIALPKLPYRRRYLVEILLETGANVSNTVLADLMDSSESAIKSLKSRTFAELRNLIPSCANELGIDFDLLLAAEPDVFVQELIVPSEDNDFEVMP